MHNSFAHVLFLVLVVLRLGYAKDKRLDIPHLEAIGNDYLVVYQRSRKKI